jgi:hypothetical protein
MPPDSSQYVTSGTFWFTLSLLNAGLAHDDSANPRALVAADVLVDCRYLGAHGPSFQLRVILWESVPVPWLTLAWLGSADVARNSGSR